MRLSAKAEVNEFRENHLAPYSTLHGTPHAPISKIADPSTLPAISWGAIFSGATVAVALALILFLLGVRLGLSSISPWTNNGIAASTLGVSAIFWLSFTQLAAYGMGGYLTGRLRTRWLSMHADEVYFRDAAHGFLTWALASLATAVLIASIIGTGVQSAAVLTSEVPSNISTSLSAKNIKSQGLNPNPIASPIDYFMSSLLRKSSNATIVADGNINLSNDIKSEIAIIFMNAIRNGDMPASDVAYASQFVSEHTGLSELEAKKRVDNTFSKLQTKLLSAEQLAKKAANTASKASAYTALWLFISLLIGAFAASWAATYGGRNRDS